MWLGQECIWWNIGKKGLNGNELKSKWWWKKKWRLCREVWYWREEQKAAEQRDRLHFPCFQPQALSHPTRLWAREEKSHGLPLVVLVGKFKAHKPQAAGRPPPHTTPASIWPIQAKPLTLLYLASLQTGQEPFSVENPFDVYCKKIHFLSSLINAYVSFMSNICTISWKGLPSIQQRPLSTQMKHRQKQDLGPRDNWALF